MYKETNPRPFRAIISYSIGIIFLYLSVFMSTRIKYNGHLITAIPVIFPLVFAVVCFALSILFIFTKKYPWFFRTGMMSLLSGISMFIFGIVVFSLKVTSFLVWASSVGIGVLFLSAAMIRFIVQGGFSAYRKAKN